MLLEQENWRLGYHQIISDCRAPTSTSNGGAVLILANPDADAMCAARILSYAFRADKVPYQLRPCGGFQKLLSILKGLNLNANADLEENDDKPNFVGGACTIRAVILLNLGATRNLQKALFEPTASRNDNDDSSDEVTSSPPLLNSEETKLYILDCHRPYHLANVYAEKNIVLWNDHTFWHKDQGGIPSDGDGLDGESDEESDSEVDDASDDDSNNFDDSDSDGEAVFEDGDVDVKNKRKGKYDYYVSADEASDLDQDIDADSSTDASVDEANTGTSKRVQSPQSESRKKARMSPATPDIEDSDNNHDDDKSTLSQAKQLSIVEKHRIRRNKIRKYYNSGSFYSSPVAHMAYTLLAEQLRHDSIGDLLWLACIGVTDAYLHNRLDLSGYAQFALMLQEKIEKVYPDFNSDDRMHERIANTLHAEELYEKDSYNGPMTQVGFSENGKIMYQRDEFRFFLLRHTSLWDAMVLSPDLNTKMELWKNSGIQKLQEMLAKMGLPLAQCQQPYAFMKPSLKRRLKFMMIEHEEEYGLEHLKYTAFVRVSGYKSIISASDMSLAVTALIECKTGESQNVGGGDRAGHDLEDVDAEEQSLISSFNVAYDALNSNGSNSTFASIGGTGIGSSTEGTDLSSIVNGGDVMGKTGLGAGIRLAISVQKAILTTAISLVERKAITRLSHFRYAYLHATSHGSNGSTRFKGGMSEDANKQNAHHIFSKPLALTKLAQYLMDMHRTNNKWTGTKSKPLILLAEKPQTQSYLVVGFEYPDIKGSVKKNSFGEKFALAANSMEGDFKFDSFDSNVVEVKGDVGRFIEQLHYMIDSV